MNSTNQHAQRTSPASESSGTLKKYYLTSRDFLRGIFLPVTLFRSWFLRWKHTEYQPKVPSSWVKFQRWKRGLCPSLLSVVKIQYFFMTDTSFGGIV